MVNKHNDVMNNKQLIPLLITGLVLIGWDASAQSTPAGTTTSTYPQGAVVTDSLPAQKGSRKNNRMTKRNNRSANAARSEEGKYRQSSTSDGTSINNSNTTNTNSNNVTTAPTGVGIASDTTSGKNTTRKPPRR